MYFDTNNRSRRYSLRMTMRYRGINIATHRTIKSKINQFKQFISL